MDRNPYKMSFSTGGLFLTESLTNCLLYEDLKDWDQVREKVSSENILQARMTSSLKRSSREIVFRLRELHENELVFLNEANPVEQKYLLWIAVWIFSRITK